MQVRLFFRLARSSCSGYEATVLRDDYIYHSQTKPTTHNSWIASVCGRGNAAVLNALLAEYYPFQLSISTFHFSFPFQFSVFTCPCTTWYTMKITGIEIPGPTEHNSPLQSLVGPLIETIGLRMVSCCFPLVHTELGLQGFIQLQRIA